MIAINSPVKGMERISLSVSLPLLRGAGRTVTREPLTQAERSLVYRLRSFELFRQDFTIQAAFAFILVWMFFGWSMIDSIIENAV